MDPETIRWAVTTVPILAGIGVYAWAQRRGWVVSPGEKKQLEDALAYERKLNGDKDKEIRRWQDLAFRSQGVAEGVTAVAREAVRTVLPSHD